MFAHKSRRAQQAGFFTVGEQHDYVVQKRSSGTDRPNGFENGGDAGAVICRTRSGFDAVVMSYKNERGAAILSAGHSRENVLNSSRLVPTPVAFWILGFRPKLLSCATR
jgi:hypothetical protein